MRQIFVGCPEGKSHSKDLDLDWRIILKLFVRKYEGSMWIHVAQERFHSWRAVFN
jgi:hypothetical protein